MVIVAQIEEEEKKEKQPSRHLSAPHPLTQAGGAVLAEWDQGRGKQGQPCWAALRAVLKAASLGEKTRRQEGSRRWRDPEHGGSEQQVSSTHTSRSNTPTPRGKATRRA